MIKDTSGQDVELTSTSNTFRYWATAIVALLLVALSAHALINTTTTSKSIDRNTLQIATLEIGDLIRDISSNGRIVAANAPQLYSPEQGFVELKVKAGDRVTTGQLVAVVESPSLQNELQQQRSELASLEGELARKKLDTRRQTLLLTKQMELAEVDLQAANREERRAQASIVDNVISQIDLEKAIDDLARAKLNFKHAKQEVELAKDTLSFELESTRNTLARQNLVVEELERKTAELNIRATVDGVVGNLLTQQRALVSQNEALMTLVDLTAYEAELNVAESVASELSLGMSVEMNISGQKVMGVLSAISPEVTNREVTTRVRFNQGDLSGVRQNQQISARILLENKANVLKVRRGSFLQAGGFIAYKVEENIARKINIQTGATSMREVEILNGLNAGDQIIISNYDEFIDTEAVLLRN
ncbi:efflux RND transporter periplasmic adaptor subunit [Aliiglaciecola sp. M165]|uniref:efflux RND transporter periplasmic adaptor subunit n=1 Tax=Aliiglaciecola sp. M165 TaxID=2593649 RepID=UPI00118102CC|nr:HlyD family efflux transporter periplasmic adaptor subunit [Aliiglaciecola sp. M165]TRY29865.1 HlyD family efflux transporter periplasmic adaptor subunit [Aliiglaciecola sp. M165]